MEHRREHGKGFKGSIHLRFGVDLFGAGVAEGDVFVPLSLGGLHCCTTLALGLERGIHRECRLCREEEGIHQGHHRLENKMIR